MTLQKRNLSEGLGFSWISTNKFKTATLSFSVCMPLDERDYLLGLVLAGVMRRGTSSLPSMTLLNRRLDELYAASVDAQCVIYGQVLCFSLSAEFLDGRFSIDGTDISGGVIDTVAEIFAKPLKTDGKFPEKNVSDEKTVVSDGFAAEKNNTRLYAATRLKELMCRSGNTHFPKLDFLTEQIGSVTAEELVRFHSKLLSLPISVFYIGAENADDICDKVSRSFAFCKGALSAFKKPLAAQPSDFISVVEDMPVNQGKLCMGMRTGIALGSDGCAAATVFNEIFGASPASKLFLNVREKLGLCYYCSSSYKSLSGEITVASGIDPKNRDRAIEEILKQLDLIKCGSISEAEFYAAIKSLEYNYSQIYDSPYSLQSFYFVRNLFGIDETVEQRKQAVLSVTPESVTALAGNVVYDTCFFINGTLTCDGAEVYDE